MANFVIVELAVD